jgi:hypothetical protein
VTRANLSRWPRLRGLGKAPPALLAVAALVAVPKAAIAAPPAPELMARLAIYGAGFEAMRTHASYTVEGRMETLDRDGKADSVKEMKARVDADGINVKFVVIRYVEDGEDKTADAQKKALKRAQERKAGGDKRFRIPILADEQPRYVFDQVEVDARDPAVVRIAFVPKVPQGDTLEGSAWVDSRTGTLVSAGFKISKPPIFVDYVHITLEFGAPTSLGPAVSKVVADGNGGVLFFRKRFHVAATLSDYRLAP